MNTWIGSIPCMKEATFSLFQFEIPLPPVNYSPNNRVNTLETKTQ